MDLSAVGVGLVLGGLLGVFGMGAGVIAAPLLATVFGLSFGEAAGTTLVMLAVTKIAGAALHADQRDVDTRLALRLAGAGAPGAVFGALLARGLPASSGGAFDGPVLLAIAVLIALAVVDGLRTPRGAAPASGDAVPLPVPAGPLPGIHALAFGAGLVTGLTSIGSGMLMAAAILALRAAPSGGRLTGTLLLQGAVVTTAGAATHLALGHINIALAGALLLGALPGVVAGTRLHRTTVAPLGQRLVTGLVQTGRADPLP